MVDGCFWHGCPEHAVAPSSNAEWWAGKIESNRQRDAHTRESLESAGWVVLRIWEHVHVDEALQIVRGALAERSAQGIAFGGHVPRLGLQAK